MSRWHNTRLSPSDWNNADVETRPLRERLPETHIPTARELEDCDE